MESIESSHPFRSSVKNGSGMECIQSPLDFRNSLKNGSGKELIESSQSSFSSKDGHIPLSTGIVSEFTIADAVSLELPGDFILSELPNITVNQSIPTGHQGSYFNIWNLSSSHLRATMCPGSTSKSPPALFDISEADSTSIKELPGSYDGQVGSEMSWKTDIQEPVFSNGHRTSHNLDNNTFMEFSFVGATADTQNSMEPVYFMPASSGLTSNQSPKPREPTRPTIQTDMQRFRDRFSSVQHQEELSVKSLQLSSPDTATTNTSGSSLSTDSGYGSAASDSYHTSATSPRSLYSGVEQFGFDTPGFYKDGQSVGLPGFSNEEDLGQDFHPQFNGTVHDELLELSAVQHGIESQYSMHGMQGMQASCFPEPREGWSESNDTGASHSYLDALVEQAIADMDDPSLWNNVYERPESQPSVQWKRVRLLNATMPGTDRFAGSGAVTLQNPQAQGSEFSPCCEEEHPSTPPWSAENVRGFDWDFDFSKLPESQLPIEEMATKPNRDPPSPKFEDRAKKCPYPGCDYKPGGREQWKRGNLTRHTKERHLPLDRHVCGIDGCKGTFTRVSNLNAHKENTHKILFYRKQRSRGEKMVEKVTKPRAGSKVEKTTKMAAYNRRQSAPGYLDITEQRV